MVTKDCTHMNRGRNSFGTFYFIGCLCDTNKCNDIVYRFGNNSEPTSKPDLASNFKYK